MFKKAKAATLLTVLFAAGSTFAVDQQVAPSSAVVSQEPVKIDLPKVSEAFGNFIGKNLKTPGVDFDVESVIKGIRDGVAGKPSPMTDKEYQQMMEAIREKAFKVESEKNIKAANEFLTKNKNEVGIVELENGKLQYKTEKPGSGEAVTAHSSPQIHYTGKFIDGTVFNSSEQAGGPVTIPLDQTIKGFSIGIIGMKEGEKRRLFVHPDLGYGITGPGNFPPNSLLIFDVELIKAKSPEQSFNDDGDDEFSGFSLADEDDEDDNDDDNDDDYDNDDKDDDDYKKSSQIKTKQ